MGVLHAHASRLHAANAPTGGAEQEHVAHHALHREIFIHRADDGFLRLRDHLVLSGVGNRAAVGDGQQPGAAACAHAMVDAVAMQQRSAAASRGDDAFGKHLQNLFESLPAQVAIRIGTADQRVEIVFGEILAGRGGGDLLRQNVQRRARDLQPVEIGGADGANQRGAFDQIVASGGEEAALGQSAYPMSGAADALQPHRNRPRRGDLAHQVHGADVDAQLQRSRGHHHAQLAVFQLFLGFQAQAAREAAVMRQYGVLAQALGQIVRDAFRQLARVDEDQSGAVLQRERGQAIVDFAPHLGAGHHT